MRPTALFPALLCVAALILSFLCLFAGRKKGFMEDYHVLTLNTSMIGQGVIDSDSTSDNPITNLLNDIDLPDSITDKIDEGIDRIAERLGIEDFYSAHILDYCFGQYTPIETANSTVDQDDISKNVTGCSKPNPMFAFDPTEIVQDALNKTNTGVTLEDLGWSDDIQRGIDALRTVSIATFVLYCISIALIFLCLIASVAAVLTSGRLTACVNLMLTILAFLSIGIASGLVTAVAVKGSNVINQYGNDIGVEAHRGSKFLAITWAATGLMFVTLIVWCLEFCIGHRRNRRQALPPKHG